ncbi:MAG: ATP-binding protein [Sporomusaceae bacterium]|nr:ATP-binding protein [Sporomusaceae bacterium]
MKRLRPLQGNMVLLFIFLIILGAITSEEKIFGNQCFFLVVFFENVLFITVPALSIAYLSIEAVKQNYSLPLLLFGCAFFISGVGAFLAGGTFVYYRSQNIIVTIHNMGVVISSLFFFLSGFLPMLRKQYFLKNPRQAIWGVYSASVILMATIAVLATTESMPPFFEPDQGATALRQVILGLAVILYSQTFVILLLRYIRTRIRFSLWFCLSILLITIGLFFIFPQKLIGGYWNILGRSMQYIGHWCAIFAIIEVALQTKSLPDQSELVARFFVEAEENYQLLVETAEFPIVATDIFERIIIWNEGAEHLFGLPKNQVIGKRLKEVLNFQEKLLQNCRQGPEKVYQNFFADAVVAGKELIPLQIFMSTRVTDRGNIRTFVFYDLTEKKQIEMELSRLRNLDLVGEMAATIAHEVRNPLTTVKGFLQYYSRNLPFKEKSSYCLMIDELDRASSIISEYLSLAKNKASHLMPRNLATVVLELKYLMEAYAREQEKTITFSIDVLHTPNALADDREIKQLLTNLVQNALDAVPTSGKVKVSVLTEEKYVILGVEDNGPGIPTDVLAKLGTPFTTTKSNGTGLGLSVCYRIAARHKATIQVASSAAGTSFSIRFPTLS